MAAKKSVQLSGVVVAESAICSIDPDEGVLMYRGYDTKPEAALARGQGRQPWQERGWTLAPRDRGPEAGMYCWMRH